ncbi:hypothetical protein KC19_VG117500 [Ceratodon purpureus]|uniref:Uncharacterized protein n=1 Tax=Ceratodon purpureus TaxID=3225 RepID=A0A8T0HPG5_CERPU|nr:hypothetical protein KC19_VG117500 [Ceratodon purpureus]
MMTSMATNPIENPVLFHTIGRKSSRSPMALIEEHKVEVAAMWYTLPPKDNPSSAKPSPILRPPPSKKKLAPHGHDSHQELKIFRTQIFPHNDFQH